MSRPLSSDILYPFIPGTPPEPIKGIKDIILVVHGTLGSIINIPLANNGAFASLHSISTGVYTFRAYVPVGNDNFRTKDTHFQTGAIPVEGFGSIKSNDGYSSLFINFSEIVSNDLTPTALEYVIEPCNIRWLQASVTEVTLANELRVSDPTERANLPNTIIRQFDAADPIKLNNGYNVDLSQSVNDLNILGNPGAGLGKAPHNMWDDIPPPVSVSPVKSINGQGPEPNGDFLFNTTEHIVVIIDGSDITIKDNSLES